MVRVKLEAKDLRNAIRENCCVCNRPTRYWYLPNDVALCPDCAVTIKAKDVPTKKEWFDKALPKLDASSKLPAEIAGTIKTFKKTMPLMELITHLSSYVKNAHYLMVGHNQLKTLIKEISGRDWKTGDPMLNTIVTEKAVLNVIPVTFDCIDIREYP